MGTPLFLNGATIPVMLDEDLQKPHEERNIIYIKTRMTYGDEQRVSGAATRLTGSRTEEGSRVSQGTFDMGVYNLLFLQTCIVRWEGPLFEGVPCTPENIERFNPDHPLLDKVLTEINTRNTGGGTSPNSSEKPGSSNSKASKSKKRQESGTTT